MNKELIIKILDKKLTKEKQVLEELREVPKDNRNAVITMATCMSIGRIDQLQDLIEEVESMTD